VKAIGLEEDIENCKGRAYHQLTVLYSMHAEIENANETVTKFKSYIDTLKKDQDKANQLLNDAIKYVEKIERKAIPKEEPSIMNPDVAIPNEDKEVKNQQIELPSSVIIESEPVVLKNNSEPESILIESEPVVVKNNSEPESILIESEPLAVKHVSPPDPILKIEPEKKRKSLTYIPAEDEQAQEKGYFDQTCCVLL